MPTATPDLSTKLNDSLAQIETILSAFFTQADAMTLLMDAFGDQVNLPDVQHIADILESGNLASFISLEVIPGGVLDGGTAAYVAESNTVYLAEEFLANALPDELVATLLQQVGYVIDDVANSTDAAGSEGAIFEAIVTGHELSPEQLADLQADTKSVQELTIENAVVSAEVSIMPPQTMDEDAMDRDKAGRQPMRGGKGRDRFRGDDEADEMFGGRGRDRLRGEGGDDKMDGGAGRDRMHGGEGADELTGGGGRDIMKGGLGDDLLNGGAGRDRLQGGEGTDIFVYDSMKDRGDLIIDFETAVDLLDLSGVLSEIGYSNSTFDELLGDVIVLGQSKRGTKVGIDADGLAGEARPRTLAALKGVNADELTSSNFIVQEAID